MTPSPRVMFGTMPLSAPRPIPPLLTVALVAAGGWLVARGDESRSVVPGASAPPPGVIAEDDAASPLAPDPESLYIRLLATDAGPAGPAATAAGDEARERGGDLVLEPAARPTSMPPKQAGAVGSGASRTPDAAARPDANGDAASAARTGDPANGNARIKEASDKGGSGTQSAGKDASDKDASDKSARKSPCDEQSQECREALKRLRDDAISDIALDIRIGGRPGSDYPCECRLEGETFKPRRFATTMMTWKAAGNCHKPLYFEDWSLERYGHSHGPLADPFFSAAHFFVTLPVLPYKMGVELPWECVYPLGYYRPGSCAPWTIPAVPISCRGFAVQAATVTGIVFALP